MATIHFSEVRVEQTFKVVIINNIGKLLGIEVGDGCGQVFFGILLNATEVVVRLHTLLRCAEEVVVVCRADDKRVGVYSDLVFI